MNDLVDQLVERRIDRRQFLRRAMAFGLSLPAASAILAACGPTAAPTTAPAKPAATTAPAAPAATTAPTAAPKPAATAPAAPAGTAAPKPAAKKVDIDKLVEGAKKEGGLSWIDATVLAPNEGFFHAAFKKKYGLPDGFKISHVVKGTGDVATTVQTETQSGNVTMDLVLLGNVPFFQALKSGGHLMAHESDEAAAVEAMAKKLGFPADPPYWYTAHSYAFSPAWNKKFVKKEIKSWLDMLDPSLKGKTIQGDLRTSSTMTDTYIGLKKALPADYYQKYRELTDPMLVFRTPEQQQKITTGERWITNWQISGRVYQAWKDDKSLEFGVAFPTEGVVPLAISIGALAKAPHPNAARLFLEFMMSKEGQQTFLDYECQWPLRTDVTYSDEISKWIQPLDKVKAITLEWDKITDKDRDAAKAEFRKTFGVD